GYPRGKVGGGPPTRRPLAWPSVGLGGLGVGALGGRGGLFGSGRSSRLGFGLGSGLLRRGLAGRLVAVGAVSEFLLAHAGGGRGGGLALEHGVGGGAGVQLHGAD